MLKMNILNGYISWTIHRILMFKKRFVLVFRGLSDEIINWIIALLDHYLIDKFISNIDFFPKGLTPLNRLIFSLTSSSNIFFFQKVPEWAEANETENSFSFHHNMQWFIIYNDKKNKKHNTWSIPDKKKRIYSILKSFFMLCAVFA